MTKTIYLKTLLFIAIFYFLTITNAYAEIDSADMLDKALNLYAAKTQSWKEVISSAASRLFWFLTIISMVWTFGLMALRKADIGEFFAEFIKFIMFTGFYWWLLINSPDFADSIYKSLRQIAGNATGIGDKLSPSGIIDIGFSVLDKVIDNSSILSPASSFVGILVGLAILAILALVGVNMLLLLISAWILAYAGIFFLGFGGSRWTSDMAINYYKTVLGIAAQLMAMILLVGVGKEFLDGYYSEMAKSGVSIKEMGVILVASAVLLALVNKIPPMLAGIISGASVGSSGIGNLGAGAAMAAAGMAVSSIKTAGSTAAGMATNAMGAGSAIKAAFSKANLAESAGDLGSINEAMRTANKSETKQTHAQSQSTVSEHSVDAAQNKSTDNQHKSAADTTKRDDAETKNNPKKSVGSIAVSAAGHLAKGITSGIKEKINDRVSQTVGGKIASAIRQQQGSPAGADGIFTKAGISLAKGVGTVMKDSISERVSQTKGGKLAERIRHIDATAHEPSKPVFNGNSLSGTREPFDQSEVDAFVHRAQKNSLYEDH